MVSVSRRNFRTKKFEATAPMAMMVTIVIANPAPGVGRFSSRSIRTNASYSKYNVNAIGTTMTRPRRKFLISQFMGRW